MTLELSALILAGGRSRRMGRDKATLTLGGESLLGRTYRLARTLGPVAIVTPWPERYRDRVPSACRWIREAPTDLGPLHGILQGLAAGLPGDWILVLACDLPHLSATELATWQTQLPDVPPAAIALLPQGPKGWEPLCGFYRPYSYASLQDYWHAGGRSLQGWLHQQTIATLQLGDRDAIFNCNTPADWARGIRDRDR